MLPLIASTFAVIFVAELPDKTAFAALALATRYRTADVIAGAWLAFVVQTVIAVAAGGVLSVLPAQPIHIAAGISFLVFALLAWRRRPHEELVAEDRDAQAAATAHRPALVSCFLVVLAAEFGDLTQLATAALAAHSASPISVGIGALAALWTVSAIAAVAGRQASAFTSARTLSRVSAVLFAVVGAVVVLGAVA
jgi:putative Ca2+/H+ antiporter (TMEM165/GDT1 family)